jgi:hypothetical protein
MRHTLTRRQFVGVTVVGLAGSADLLRSAPAWSKSTSAPKPIPGGLLVPAFETVPANPDVHVLPPFPPFEMSTITDFNGTVAATEIQGTATGSDGSSWYFDTDMRFMDGEYVGEDGKHHHGTFGFV